MVRDSLTIPPAPLLFMSSHIEAGEHIELEVKRGSENIAGVRPWKAKIAGRMKHGFPEPLEEYAEAIASSGLWAAACECRNEPQKIVVTVDTVDDPLFVGVKEVHVQPGPKIALTVAVVHRAPLRKGDL